MHAVATSTDAKYKGEAHRSEACRGEAHTQEQKISLPKNDFFYITCLISMIILTKSSGNFVYIYI